MSTPAGRRPVGWQVAAAVVFLGAGLLFATSRGTARGTELRSDRIRLSDAATAQQRLVRRRSDEVTRLQAELARDTAAAAARDSRVKDAEQAGRALAGPAGLAAVRGTGVAVSLDDAPRLAGGETRRGNPSPDDLVVHQQDVVGVVNALWAGGAEAMSIMGKRVIATTTVRCVGNTLFLQDDVYSPPFVIRAVGDPARLHDALEAAPPVQAFRQAVAAWGLGYSAATDKDLAIAAYDGPLTLLHAQPVGP
ncbi:MAG: hypothetical protein QOG49_746 [Frankiaceae bacterium]|nr:hypothetical protein [Frankiaceae bacterium]